MLQFIHGARFMASSSNLVNTLSGGIYKFKCKYGYDDKKCETCGIQYKYCDCFLQDTNFKVDLIECKCLCCNKNHQQVLIHTNFLTTIIISFFIVVKTCLSL